MHIALRRKIDEKERERERETQRLREGPTLRIHVLIIDHVIPVWAFQV